MSQANEKRLAESVAQLRAGNVVENKLIDPSVDVRPAANMEDIRTMLGIYGYAHVDNNVELTSAQREELSVYGFVYDEKSRRVSRA